LPRRQLDTPGQRTFDELLAEPDPNIVVRCRGCRRPLKDRRARAAGIGRTCQKKLAGYSAAT
jgi:hypothetical protein